MSSEKWIAIDIETNGFNPSVIWCVCAQDSHGALFTTRNREELIGWLKDREGYTVYGHNAIRFDYPILARLWGIDWSAFTLRDTLVLSYLDNPSRNGHSLALWASRLGYTKGDHSDWSQWSKEMQDYCELDTFILCKLVEHFLALELSPEAVELEHRVAEIIHRQIQRGWLLDVQKCFLLLAELKEKKLELEDEVRKTFVPLPAKGRAVVPKVNKDGSLSSVGLKCLGDKCRELAAGPFTQVTYPEFNLGSRQQIGRHLQFYGWTPTVFTETGQAQVDETTLEGVDLPEAKLIAEYLMVVKRIAQIQSWVDAADSNDRVHGDVRPCGAVTGRMTHNEPNMAQVPASNKPYGKACRSVWGVPKGYRLVGCDAEGLELRMLAHYMADQDYIKTVCEGNKDDGTDVHTSNQRAARLATRDQAKTFIYAFLYGAGDAKIGAITGQSAQAGRKLKTNFLRAVPSLATLKENVENAASRGWLKGLDGRKIHVRSTHAALNTLLQGGGAVFMKKALVLLDYHITKRGLDAHFVGNIHDEFQLEVREDHAETVAWLATSCMVQAGKQLGLRCPTAGKSAIGTNWSDTH